MTDYLGLVRKVNHSIHKQSPVAAKLQHDGRSLSSKWRPDHFFFFILLCVSLSVSSALQWIFLNGAKTIKVTHTGIAYVDIRGMIQYSRQSKNEERCAYSRVISPPSASADSRRGNFARSKFGHRVKSEREYERLISFFFSSSEYQIINHLWKSV